MVGTRQELVAENPENAQAQKFTPPQSVTRAQSKKNEIEASKFFFFLDLEFIPANRLLRMVR